MRSLVALAAFLALAACSGEAHQAASVSPEQRSALVLQPEDVTHMRRSGAGPPRRSGENPVGDGGRAWHVGFRSLEREITGVFIVEAEAEVFDDALKARRAFGRLLLTGDEREPFLTGLPATRFGVPGIGDIARGWTADFDPLTVAAIAWRSGNVVAWVALQGPDPKEAAYTALSLARKQQKRIEQAASRASLD